jgi:hypothetical protein
MVWNFIVQIVASLVLTAISYALSPKPKREAPKAAGLDDFDLPTAEEGRQIPVVFGTMLLRGAAGRIEILKESNTKAWSAGGCRHGTVALVRRCVERDRRSRQAENGPLAEQ